MSVGKFFHCGEIDQRDTLVLLPAIVVGWSWPHRGVKLVWLRWYVDVGDSL